MFSNPFARIFDDADRATGEQREIIIGHSARERLLLVSFTEREDLIRIISYQRRPRMSGRTTKKVSRRKAPASREELRREYRFDYAKARPNRLAAMLRGRTTAVVLDPDVASVFESPESVNRLLRSVIAALPADVKPNRRRERSGA